MEDYKMEDVVVERFRRGLLQMAEELEDIKNVNPTNLREALVAFRDYVDAAIPAFDFAIWSKEFDK